MSAPRPGEASATGVAPRLLLVCDDAAHRLKLVGLLRADFQLRSVTEGEDLLRLARSQRPDAVLIVGSASERVEALRRCRVLRTDLVPFPQVGVVLTGAGAPEVDEVRGALATGYLGGHSEPATILEFARAVAAGRGSYRRDTREVGGLRRLWRRVVG